MSDNAKFEFPWERQAQRGDLMPDGLSLPDQMAYPAMRNIYLSFQEKRISQKQAAQEKCLLRREWEEAKKAEAFEKKLSDHHVRLWRAVERAACACRKNPTKENAVRLCDAVDGIQLELPGRWIMRGGKFRCSVCDAQAAWECSSGVGGWSKEYTQAKTPYCPNCGGRMDGSSK